MNIEGGDFPRTVVLAADREPFPVVFEMLAHTVVVQPHESLRLVVSGPTTAELTIGYGPTGVSVFRDEDLQVQVYDHDGELLSVPGW
jgi:hypothetical protein